MRVLFRHRSSTLGAFEQGSRTLPGSCEEVSTQKNDWGQIAPRPSAYLSRAVGGRIKHGYSGQIDNKINTHVAVRVTECLSMGQYDGLAIVNKERQKLASALHCCGQTPQYVTEQGNYNPS